VTISWPAGRIGHARRRVQLGISIVGLATLIAILVLRPRSSAGAGLGLVLAAGLLVGGVAPRSTGRLLVESTLPLVAFLTGAIWLALYAEREGVSRWLADHLLAAARGRPVALLGLVALVAAALTATVSLDGAIVLVVPLILDLVRAAPALRGALLGAGIAVTNAFSFAVPQGNPANLVLIQRLHLSPGAFVAHLAVPATLATAVCLLGVAIAERGGLRDARIERVRPVRRERSLRPALLVLGAAAAGGVAAPWLGIASWLPLSVVALAAWIVLRLGDRDPPRLPVPWRVGAQIAALLVCAESFVHAAGLPRAEASSTAGLLAVALGVAAVASLVNNLPASVLVAGILAGPPATAYATLIGLAPGSLATPHGSVATMLAFQRAGDEPGFVRYVRWWLPISLVAVVAAVLALR
jgi:arsenical pump membrane protein